MKKVLFFIKSLQISINYHNSFQFTAHLKTLANILSHNFTFSKQSYLRQQRKKRYLHEQITEMSSLFTLFFPFHPPCLYSTWEGTPATTRKRWNCRLPSSGGRTRRPRRREKRYGLPSQPLTVLPFSVSGSIQPVEETNKMAIWMNGVWTVL